MGLLSGTKRINRDGIGEMGLLSPTSFNVGGQTWYGAEDPSMQAGSYVSSLENGTETPYGSPLYVPNIDFSRLGYSGPVYDDTTMIAPGSDSQDAQTTGGGLNANFQNWMTQNGYQPVYSRGGNEETVGLMDRNGQIVNGSTQTTNRNEVNFLNSALAMMAIPAAYAASGYGAAGGGESLSGMDLAADGGSNALWQTGAQGTNTLGSIPQTSSNVAPLESVPQVTAPELAQVPQVPATTSPMTYEQMVKAAEAASAAKAATDSKPDQTNYSNEGSNYPTTDSTQGSGGSPANASEDWMNSLKNYGGSIADWMKQNPAYAKALFGAIGAAGAVSGNKSGGSGYVDSGYRPTISRGGWQANVTPTYSKPQTQAPGLLNVPATGQQNDGLWRFGLLGK